MKKNPAFDEVYYAGMYECEDHMGMSEHELCNYIDILRAKDPVAVKAAIRDLLGKFHLGDYVYNVRERADKKNLKDNESSWDHPDVKRFSEICNILKEYVNGGTP